MFRALVITLTALAAPAAHAQFSNTPLTDTGFAWFLSGDLVRGEGAPPIEANDEIGAFFGETLVGSVRITAAQAASSQYSRMPIFGDDPNTAEVEGPTLNEVVTLRYYDSSTNSTLTDVRAINTNGEAINLAWQGSEVFDIPDFPFPDILNPSTAIDIRIGAGSGDNNNGGNNGGGETPTGNPDVDGDGRVTRNDAAMVLRVVIGGGRSLDDATVARADVDGNGTVNTDDAIAVYKAM